MLTFSDVSSVFLETEKKSGRLEMTDLIADLLKRADKDEISKLVYLMQGILAPPYSGIDIGLGEQFAIRAICSATGYTQKQVDERYKKTGDLGLTVEELMSAKKQQSLYSQQMNVLYVHASLMRIAQTSGSGSQELKIKYLTELLNNASPLESRFLIRFVLGRLRLGIGDPTILDALSVSSAGNKSMRDYVERAYNTCADLGLGRAPRQRDAADFLRGP